MNYIETTATDKELTIKAFINKKVYESGISFNKSEVENNIKIKRSNILPQWNYEIMS